MRINSWLLFNAILKLSLFSLFLSHTLRYLEFSWSTLGRCDILGDLEQKGKGRVGKHKRTPGSTTTTSFDCRYQVTCMFSSLFLAWMVYACGFLVMICHSHLGFIGLTVDFPILSISWIAMVLCVQFHCLFSCWFSCFFSCGSSY